MTIKQFKKTFFRGLGSAIMVLENSPDKDKYRDIVLFACLNNTSYDMQSEGDKSEYLFHAIELLGALDEFEDAIIERFMNLKHDYWLFNQLASLLYLYANKGSEKAKKALFDKYKILLYKLQKVRKHRAISEERDMHECLSVWLTSLCGFSAFKRIVSDYGRNITNGKVGFFSYVWFYDNAQNKFGKKRVDKYLQKQADRSAEVKAFYEQVRIDSNGTHVVINKPTLEEVIQNAYKVQDGITILGRGMALRFARNASVDELKRLAEAAINEQDLNIKAELLWIFRKVKYKFPDEILKDFINSENEDIRDTAFYIMGQFPSEEMHDFALSLINDEEDLVYGVLLLCKNFKREDEKTLFDAIKSVRVSKNSFWHSVYMAVEDAFDKGKWKPQTDILQYIYENTLCSYCRLKIVKLMGQHGVLTKQILNECLYDSNSDIRAFAKRRLKRDNLACCI